MKIGNNVWIFELVWHLSAVIQKQVLNELSKAMLAQKVDKTQNVVMDMFDGKIVFRKPIHAHEELTWSDEQ